MTLTLGRQSQMNFLSSSNSKLFENNDESSNPAEKDKVIPEKKYVKEIVWKNVIYLVGVHILSIFGVYSACTSAKWATLILVLLMYLFGGMGVTAGAHRLWSHRAYKAKWPLRVILMLLNLLTLQHGQGTTEYITNTAIQCLIRIALNGDYFFHTLCWLCLRKHPDVIEKGKGVDMSDLYADPVLTFQKKYYWFLMTTVSLIIPNLTAVYCWNESWVDAFLVSSALRTTLMWHSTFLVNSLAHYSGYKPYDKNIRPVQNVTVSMLALGEGWHNYHHTFPWDYKTSELGNYSVNFTNAFIDFFAWIGWAYDLKTVSQDMIKKRVQRTGDGSHELWGWNDKDITKEDKEVTIITYKNNSE